MSESVDLTIRTKLDTAGITDGIREAQREADAAPLRVGTATLSGSFAGESRSALAPGVTTVTPAALSARLPSESVVIQRAGLSPSAAASIESLLSPGAIEAFTAATTAAARRIEPPPPPVSPEDYAVRGAARRGPPAYYPPDYGAAGDDGEDDGAAPRRARASRGFGYSRYNLEGVYGVHLGTSALHQAGSAAQQYAGDYESYRIAQIHARGDPIREREAEIGFARQTAGILRGQGGVAGTIASLVVQPGLDDERALEAQRVGRENSAAGLSLAAGDRAAAAGRASENRGSDVLANLTGIARARAASSARRQDARDDLYLRERELEDATRTAATDPERHRAEEALSAFRRRLPAQHETINRRGDAELADIARGERRSEAAYAGEVEVAGLRGQGRDLAAEVAARRNRAAAEAAAAGSPRLAAAAYQAGNADIAALVVAAGRQAELANRRDSSAAGVSTAREQIDHGVALAELGYDSRKAGILRIQGDRDLTLRQSREAEQNEIDAITDPDIRARREGSIRDRYAAERSRVRHRTDDDLSAFDARWEDRRFGIAAQIGVQSAGLREILDPNQSSAVGHSRAQVSDIVGSTLLQALGLSQQGFGQEAGAAERLGSQRLKAFGRDYVAGFQTTEVDPARQALSGGSTADPSKILEAIAQGIKDLASVGTDVQAIKQKIEKLGYTQ